MTKRKPPIVKSRTARFKAYIHREISPLASWVSIGLLSTAVGAAIYIEHEFAHAGPTEQRFATMTTGQEINRLTTETETMKVRLELLRTQQTAITYAPGPKTRERDAAIERLKTDIGDLGAELAAKKQLLDRLRTGK